MPTTPTQMRLTEETLADLKAIAEALCRDGLTATRSDAVRYAARLARRHLEKKSKKSDSNA